MSRRTAAVVRRAGAGASTLQAAGLLAAARTLNDELQTLVHDDPGKERPSLARAPPLPVLFYIPTSSPDSDIGTLDDRYADGQLRGSGQRHGRGRPWYPRPSSPPFPSLAPIPLLPSPSSVPQSSLHHPSSSSTPTSLITAMTVAHGRLRHGRGRRGRRGADAGGPVREDGPDVSAARRHQPRTAGLWIRACARRAAGCCVDIMGRWYGARAQANAQLSSINFVMNVSNAVRNSQLQVRGRVGG